MCLNASASCVVAIESRLGLESELDGIIGLDQKWYFHSILKNVDLNVDLTPQELGVRVHECTSLNILFRNEYRHVTASLKLGIPCPSQKPMYFFDAALHIFLQNYLRPFFVVIFFLRCNARTLKNLEKTPKENKNLRKYNFEGIF